MQRLSIVRSSGFVLTSILFFASGFAALLYQIAWQRMLFGWYGVDLDSISVIISIFMLGLGIGAIAGGWLADRFQGRRILVFSMIELTIGTFGFFSLGIIDYVGELFTVTSIPRLVGFAFLMGHWRVQHLAQQVSLSLPAQTTGSSGAWSRGIGTLKCGTWLRPVKASSCRTATTNWETLSRAEMFMTAGPMSIRA